MLQNRRMPIIRQKSRHPQKIFPPRENQHAQKIQRKYPQHPPRIKIPKIVRPPHRIQQNPGDQKPRQHKKQIHPHPPRRHPTQMRQQPPQHRHPPHQIQRRQPRPILMWQHRNRSPRTLSHLFRQGREASFHHILLQQRGSSVPKHESSRSAPHQSRNPSQLRFH